MAAEIMITQMSRSRPTELPKGSERLHDHPVDHPRWTVRARALAHRELAQGDESAAEAGGLAARELAQSAKVRPFHDQARNATSEPHRPSHTGQWTPPHVPRRAGWMLAVACPGQRLHLACLAAHTPVCCGRRDAARFAEPWNSARRDPPHWRSPFSATAAGSLAAKGKRITGALSSPRRWPTTLSARPPNSGSRKIGFVHTWVTPPPGVLCAAHAFRRQPVSLHNAPTQSVRCDGERWASSNPPQCPSTAPHPPSPPH